MADKTTTPSELCAKIAKFIDRNGKVLEKGSDPFNAYLRMEYIKGDMKATLNASQSPYSNGSTIVQVEVNGRNVLTGKGDMWLKFGTVDVEPGEWMDTF